MKQHAKNLPPAKKLASCIRSMHHEYIDIRYIDKRYIEVLCIGCQQDISGRLDYEPLLQGLQSALPIRRFGYRVPIDSEKRNVWFEHVGICATCIDKYTREVESTEVELCSSTVTHG